MEINPFWAPQCLKTPIIADLTRSFWASPPPHTSTYFSPAWQFFPFCPSTDQHQPDATIERNVFCLMSSNSPFQHACQWFFISSNRGNTGKPGLKSQTVDSFPWWASPGICTNYFWGDLLMHHSPSSPCGDNGMLWNWKNTSTLQQLREKSVSLAFCFICSNHLQLFCWDADQPHMDSGCLAP